MQLPAPALIFLLFFMSFSGTAQTDSTLDKVTRWPSKLFQRIGGKAADVDRQLTRKTQQYLQRLSKDEARLKKEFYRMDASKAASLFAADPQAQYAAWQQKMQTDSAGLAKLTGGEYLSNLDSLHGSLSFLNAHPGLTGASPTAVKAALGRLQGTQQKLADANEIGQFIAQRKAQIRQYLLEQTNIPPGIQRIYKDYNTQLYYYNQQVSEYKQLLNDPDRMTARALSLLKKLPAFTRFMSSNSFLSGLFVTPDYSDARALSGLQTRDQVMGMIQSRIASGGPNAMAAFSQRLQSASEELQQLKAKVSSLGESGTNMDVPEGFKPNAQKTKSFFRRLEGGVNLQTAHGNNYLPTTTDLGLSVGYKLDNNKTAGVGASYKFGWTNASGHVVHMSNQGLGLRSFVDIRLKGTFYCTGGFEYNYQAYWDKLNIPDLSNWSRSGLIGVSKVIPTTTKFIKKTKVQLLWDFLSYRQVPHTQPIKFRVGYNF